MKNTPVTELEVLAYEHMCQNIHNDPSGTPSDQDVADAFIQGFLLARTTCANRYSWFPHLSASELCQDMREIGNNPCIPRLYDLGNEKYKLEWSQNGRVYFECKQDENLFQKAREVSKFIFFSFNLCDKDGNLIPAFV